VSVTLLTFVKVSFVINKATITSGLLLVVSVEVLVAQVVLPRVRLPAEPSAIPSRARPPTALTCGTLGAATLRLNTIKTTRATILCCFMV
jgi:hypothetical protein